MKNNRSIRLFFLTLAIAVCVPLVAAQTPAERAARAGEVFTSNGHRVLRLFGDDIHERGFAHGYLLGDELIAGFDATLRTSPDFNTDMYEKQLMTLSKTFFKWDADATAEMKGIFEGLIEKVGKERVRSAVLNRALAFEDVVAMNVIPDAIGPACSGVAVWGARSAEGKVLHARNCDLVMPDVRALVAMQIVFVNLPLPARGEQPARRGWAGVGWPGLICQFTAMNDGGLVAAIHDANNPKSGIPWPGMTARGLLLRRVLEAVDPASKTPLADAQKFVGDHRVYGGNLFHLSWPAKGTEPPTGILEFDVTGAPDPRVETSGVVVVTNHFCVRGDPLKCRRFTAMSDRIAAYEKAGTKLGLKEVQALLTIAEQAGTAHTIYFFPESFEMHVALTNAEKRSPRVEPVKYSLKELMTRK